MCYFDCLDGFFPSDDNAWLGMVDRLMIGHDIKAWCWFIELLLTVLGGILQINGVDFF